MKFEKKHYIFILFALLISVVALAQEITNTSDTEKVNKSGDTMTGNLYLSKIMSKHGANLSYFGFPVSTYSEWYQNTSGLSDNRIRLYSDTVAFYSDIDLNNHNISECGNCGSSASDNSKVNKSGDNMTGMLNTPQIIVGEALNQTLLYRFNYTQIFGKDQYTVGAWGGDFVGLDAGNINASGNVRTTLRLSAGNGLDPNTNPNFVWQIYSNTHSTNRGLLALYDRKQLYFGCGSLTNANTGDQCVIDFYTVNKTNANGTSASGALAMKLDGEKNITVIGQKTSGSGYDYVCVEKATGKQINSPTACDLI